MNQNRGPIPTRDPFPSRDREGVGTTNDHIRFLTVAARFCRLRLGSTVGSRTGAGLVGSAGGYCLARASEGTIILQGLGHVAGSP